MKDPDEEDINEDFLQNARREKTKNELLDETFKKAEIVHGLRPSEKKIIPKRPFLKSGIVLLVIAILCLVIIDNAPWMYIKYDDPALGVIEETFGRDLKNEKFDKIENADSTVFGNIQGLFESRCNNCSNNSQHFIGLSIDDFSSTPKMTFYAFMIMALMGIIFTLFQVIDKLRRFSFDTVAIIHSIFAAGIIFASTYVLLLVIKFFGTYLLIVHNGPFSPLDELRVVFIAPVILIVIAAILIKGATAILKMNFNELKMRFKTDIPEDSFSIYRFGGKPR